MTMVADPLRSKIVETGGSHSGEEAISAVVDSRRDIADGVIELVFRAADGGELPRWEPGAHVDVVLSDGEIRQYSLCGQPSDRTTYRVAVLLEKEGRGGSRRIHAEFWPGSPVELKGPRNHFPLRGSPRYLFIAGGIGVTPLIPMMRAVEAVGADWRFVYGGRSESTMGYVDELKQMGDRVTIWPEDTHGLLDLADLLGTAEEETLVYSCGPEPLLAAVEQRCASWPGGALNIERFTAAEIDTSADTGFEVQLAQSGLTVHVAEDQTILEMVTEAGIYVPTSCTEGTCGSCETPILEGTAEHRDVVLTPEEQEAQETMMICVSRASCPRIVLDL